MTEPQWVNGTTQSVLAAISLNSLQAELWKTISTFNVLTNWLVRQLHKELANGE